MQQMESSRDAILEQKCEIILKEPEIRFAGVEP